MTQQVQGSGLIYVLKCGGAVVLLKISHIQNDHIHVVGLILQCKTHVRKLKTKFFVPKRLGVPLDEDEKLYKNSIGKRVYQNKNNIL